MKSANNDGCLIDVNGAEYPYLYNTNFKAYLIDTNRHTCTLLSNSAVGAYISSRNSDAFVYTSGYRGGMWNMYIYVR